MKGFYYNKMSVKGNNDPLAFFRKAAIEYLAAAKCYPEDDEHHPCKGLAVILEAFN